jgi:hypothetical protein
VREDDRNESGIWSSLLEYKIGSTTNDARLFEAEEK